MFYGLISFLLVFVPAFGLLSMVFFAKEPLVRLLAFFCFLAPIGFMNLASYASNDYLLVKINALESKVRILEYRNELEDQQLQRRVEELLKK